MTNVTPPSPHRPGKPELITSFFAIVTTDDVPTDKRPAGSENVMAVVAGDKVMPLITTKRAQAIDAWNNLMQSDDPQFNGRIYRLIGISGKREVLLEHHKSAVAH